MRRRYYRSPLGTFARWILGTALLFLGMTFFSWVATVVLPRIAPFLLVGLLVVAVVWAVDRLR